MALVKHLVSFSWILPLAQVQQMKKFSGTIRKKLMSQSEALHNLGFIYLLKHNTMFIYLSCATLTTDHQGLIHWLHLALHIPVGLFRHYKNMGFEFLYRGQC